MDLFIHLQFLRKFLLGLPGVTEGVSHGTPGFYVQKKFLARLWENGEVLVVRTDERDKWINIDPKIFFFTDHYRDYPTVLVNLELVEPAILEQLLIEAWKGRASKTLLKAYSLNPANSKLDT
ncbi:MAG: MmcQ/YjbR family DNA-binding protein [Bacteroidetes bacterium]|nr:MmcQ/YjbR family DNA-binding protein [Bacteroidota bacterium]